MSTDDVDETARLVLSVARPATFAEFRAAFDAEAPGWGIAEHWRTWTKYHGEQPGWPQTHDPETGRPLPRSA